MPESAANRRRALALADIPRGWPSHRRHFPGSGRLSCASLSTAWEDELQGPGGFQGRQHKHRVLRIQPDWPALAEEEITVA